MEREFLSDARGRRHTMVAGLCNIRRGEPLSDVEDAVLAAALAELDEKYVGEPTLSDLVQVIEDRPPRLAGCGLRRGIRPALPRDGARFDPHDPEHVGAAR